MLARSLITSFALVTAARNAAAQDRACTLEDAVQVEGIDDVQLAPDGRVAPIAVTRGDVARNAFARIYQLVDVDTGKASVLPERLQNPRWSPSGAAIAWLARGRPDPRGSDGYGDWSYKAIVGNLGDGPMADALAGVAAVLASGVGDKDRLFLEGASYGGYLTSWIITHDHRFQAAVAAVPLINLRLDYTLSESPNITRRFDGDKPTLDAALLERESPITYASANKTPLLVEIGLRDTRAPYVQAIELYKVVAEAGVDARLLIDTESGHGPSDPRGVLQWQQATLGWFAGHGGPALPGAALPK